MISTPTPSELPQDETEPRFDFRQQAGEPAQLPDVASRQIQWQARRLEVELPSTVVSREDHQQDLTLDLLKKLPHFDETRAGLRTYSARIVASSASNRRRHHRAEKRAGQTIALDTHHDTEASAECIELAMDSQVCLEQLTPLQRQLCHYLGDSPEREIAKKLGLTRHNVRRQIQQIRRCFVRNEMHAYL